VAQVSYLRFPSKSDRAASSSDGWQFAGRRGGGGGHYLAIGALVLAIVAVAAFLIVFGTASGRLSADSLALAKVSMPSGGGRIASASVVTGPHSRQIPVVVRGDRIFPTRRVAPHLYVTVDVTIKRPGWISWLAGSTEHLELNLYTPSAGLRSHYLTLRDGAPIKLSFRDPVRVIAYGTAGHLTRRELPTPQRDVSLPRTAEAGSMQVAAVPRTWESLKPSVVSWFPAGGAVSAVAQPSPGTLISPHTHITLTFSEPVSRALGTVRPPVSPATAGTWHAVNDHSIAFEPEGYGYGLGANVNVELPSGVRLVGGQSTGTSTVGHWTVPPGSTVRLQQLLATLGYLPFKVRYRGAAVRPTAVAQEAAAVAPPAARFVWRYPNVPPQLRAIWAPGTFGEMTKGALMAFQNDRGLATDGSPGPDVWRTLISDVAEHKGASTFGYSYVIVDKESSPQHLTVWHSGKTVHTAPVNTGIASAPTVSGTFAVFEHLPVTTMSGNNPDGSHYSDPGIQYVSYFNGGDALHAFTRAQFGYPQSLGCVEMTLSDAAAVYPYTPIGTLVSVV
jgi:peptidoglycan hydrolase-like protein with peptidoglycan-binding domain